jgi:CO/xanthine dehydrogenase Mo-binding subunit
VPHARIRSIDTSAAEAHPGVKAVHVLDRVLGLVLAGIAVQFIINGLVAAGLVAPPR